MAQYCVMVKGPCRGKMCDFWARVKIRKTTDDELLVGIREAIKNCKIDSSVQVTEVIREYWIQLGVRNFERLRDEEPKLWTKMMQIDALVKKEMQYE